MAGSDRLRGLTEQIAWEQIIARHVTNRDLEARVLALVEDVSNVDNPIGRIVKRLSDEQAKKSLRWTVTFPDDNLRYRRIPLYKQDNRKSNRTSIQPQWQQYYSHLGNDWLAMYHFIKRLQLHIQTACQGRRAARIVVNGDFGPGKNPARINLRIWSQDASGRSQPTPTYQFKTVFRHGQWPAHDRMKYKANAGLKHLVKELLRIAHPLFLHLVHYPLLKNCTYGKYYYLYSHSSPDVSSFIFLYPSQSRRNAHLSDAELDSVFAFLARVVQPAVSGEFQMPTWDRFLTAYHLKPKKMELSSLRSRLRSDKGIDTLADKIISISGKQVYTGQLPRALLWSLATALRAPSKHTNILLQASPGTGKGQVARLYARVLRTRKFEQVNCLSLDTDFESFCKRFKTRARHRTSGKRQRRSKCVVFLDEIDKSSRRVQALLLHLLEERKVYVNGKELRINAPVVIAAGSQDFEELIRKKGFLEDLYSRFHDKVVLEPLARRPSEILVLARAFMEKNAKDYKDGKPIKFDEFAAWLLYSHKWKRGNLRELHETVLKLHMIARKEKMEEITPEMIRRHARDLGAFGEFVMERSVQEDT